MDENLSTDLLLTVTQVAAHMSVHSGNGEPTTSHSFSLVLRAIRNTNIALSSGVSLDDVDIHITLSTEWCTGPELDRDLSHNDVGYLAYTDGERDEPFIHGAAFLKNSKIVRLLLTSGVTGIVNIILPTVPFSESPDEPYVWGKNRQNVLRISHFAVSAIAKKVEQEDS